MPKTHILTLEQMRVYASPVRQRIVASLMARGSGSIAEVASDMGRRADTLYHHIRLLLKQGLIQRTGDRVAGKNREAIYAPTAPRFSANHDTEDEAYLREFARLVKSVMADAAVHHSRAYASKKARRHIVFETANVRLREDQIGPFNDALAELVAKAKAESDPKGGRHLFTFLSCPLNKT